MSIVFCGIASGAGALAVAYAFLLWRIVKTWSEQETQRKRSEYPEVDVVIAARNEAQTIESCCQSILSQDYPAKYRVIIIDDHSSDETALIIEKLASSRIQLLQLSDINEQGKKAAIRYGIAHSTGDVIVTTDADCRVSTRWLQTLMQERDGYEMMLGPVRIVAKKGLLNAFQGLDVAGTILMTGATTAWGNSLLANGANFAFSRPLFKRLGAYEGNESRASGDDVFLLHKAVQEDPSQIAFCFHESAIVETQAETTWSGLFQQRLRWAAKTSAYQNKQLVWFQAGVYLLCVYSCLSPVFYYWNPSVYWCLPVLLKVATDYLYLTYAARSIGQPVWMRWFLPIAFLHILYLVVIGTWALLPVRFYWKGRRVR